ncbi:MAG: hypothetical protein IPL65_13595 [Lewinellaceae bacterium]|nr:hypothetical protein [Lewinellaceae bacterium]
MKKLLFALFLSSAFSSISAQTTCNDAYGYMEEGSRLEYTSYDKNDKVTSVYSHQCKNIEESNDTLIAYLDVKGTDAKGEDTYAGMYTMKCLNGTIFMDMRSLMPATATANTEMNMEMQIDGADLSFPSNMAVGESLEDGEMVMRMMSNDVQVMQMRFLMTNRKVDGKETVTTAAGTFDCIKMSYDMEFKMLMSRSYRNTQWYAKGVGMIKSETYDKKGRLDSRMELTKFEK